MEHWRLQSRLADRLASEEEGTSWGIKLTLAYELKCQGLKLTA